MERQELYCHACEKYVQFDVPETNGDLVIICSNCKHEHCRIVENGVITGDRWSSRNGNNVIIYATGTACTTTSYITISTTATTGSASYFIAQSWANTQTVSSY